MSNYSKEDRRNKVLKYFKETPPKPDNRLWIVLIAAFSLLLIKGYIQAGIQGAFFIFMGLVGLYVVIRKLYQIGQQYRSDFNGAEPKATDVEMDEWLAIGYDRTLKMAKRRLGIDDEDISAEPLKIDGPNTEALIGPGRDRMLRFNRHDILLLFLTEHNIAAYKCIFDLGTGEILEDHTKEIAFRDITSLETRRAGDIFVYGPQKIRIEGIQNLTISTSGGNVIAVNYFLDRKIQEDNSFAPPSDAGQTIMAIRKRLMEYTNKQSG